MKNNCFERAEILCVGTELLIGDIVNTNAAYLSRRLATIGIGVYRQAVVGDNPERLAEDVREALSRSDLVVMSGGLGPTMDDLTKETVARVLGRPLSLHEPSLRRIEEYFTAKGRVMTENNRKQAMMPEGAVVFPNDYGTAPALALEDERGHVVVMLPGPPRELEPLFAEQVEPYLKKRTNAVLYSRNLHIIGIGESVAETLLPREVFESENPTVAPYCAPGEMRLRVTAKAPDDEQARVLVDRMVERLLLTPVGRYVYGFDLPSPEHALVEELLRRGKTIATAESCTGGLIAKRLTDVPGSSGAVAGGMVTYQTDVKVKQLGVDAALIEECSVVSDEVAREMACRAREYFGTDLGIGVTGYAGPTGGTERDPVGTVYIAVCDGRETVSRRLVQTPLRDRGTVREIAATNAICQAIGLLRASDGK